MKINELVNAGRYELIQRVPGKVEEKTVTLGARGRGRPKKACLHSDQHSMTEYFRTKQSKENTQNPDQGEGSLINW